MAPDRTPPSPDAPRERDAGVRATRRVGYGVAAAAVLGTALFAGLAASHDTSAAAATGASPVSSSTPAVTTPRSAEAPVASGLTPVAPSGGS